MRSRCGTSRHGSRNNMELERPKVKEEPHLSGAYIRSLVKQLSSSMPKAAVSPKFQDGASGDGESPSNPSRLGEGFGAEAQKEQQHQEKATPPRKQTRRRVCTSKPYQERLINMAEARREIVTALKFHRAAMKRASEQQQQQQKSRLQQEINSLQVPPPPPCSQDLDKLDTIGRESPGVYPSNNNMNMLFTYLNDPSLPSASYPPNPWPPCSSLAPLSVPGNPNYLALPTRPPLGLNLNLQDFSSIDINLYSSRSSGNPPMLISSASSTSSPSYSHSFASPTTSVPATLGFPSAVDAPLQPSTLAMSKPDGVTLHPTMGDEEMAEIRSIGEQHDMEWNDKLNAVTSAWWCKLLETMEASPQAQQLQEARNITGGEGMMVGTGLGSFDEAMDTPAWLSDQQEVGADDDYYCSEYLQDVSLPRLDNIGDIEGTDCERL